MKRNHIRRHGIALASMVLGSATILGLVVVMNEFSQAPERDLHTTVADISVRKLEPPEPKQTFEKPEPKPQTPPLTPPVNPLRGLNSALPGLDVGIPSVDLGQIVGAADTLFGAAQDVVMTSDTVDEPPQPVQQGGMLYPAEARAKGVEGYVLLSVLVNKQGLVERVKVLSSEPGGVFAQIAAQGIQSWRFTPARYKGEPVKTWVRQRINFNLS